MRGHMFFMENLQVLSITQKCFNIEARKTVNFPFRTNGKFMVLSVPKVHLIFWGYL